MVDVAALLEGRHWLRVMAAGEGRAAARDSGCGSLNSPSRGGHARRTVIFSADDFGSSEAVNGAVALAHRQGLLGSASLMAAGPQVAAAVRLAKELPGLCLGVHLTLIKGRAISSPQKIPHLVDSQGHFGNCPVAVGWRYFLQPRLLPEIRRELASQIEAVLRLGLQPWHLNSHLNLHMHPRIFPLVVDLAREYDIPAVRLVREDWRTTLALAPDHPFPKLAQGLIFALLCRRARRIARAAGLFSNDQIFGLLNDGRMTETYLLDLIPRLQAGVTEIYSHPGLTADPEMPAYRRQQELAALLSPQLKSALAAAAVELSDFAGLSRRMRTIRKSTSNLNNFSD